MELTAADGRRLAEISELMLRPFEHRTPLKYLVAVAEGLRPLVGAFASMCGTRDPEGEIGLASAQWSAKARASYGRWKLRDAGTERALTLPADVVSMRRLVNNDWESFNQDPMVSQWYRPNGIRDVVAYLLHWSEDDALATIELHGDTFGLPRFGEEGEFLLIVLQPSFRAGMRLLYSVGQLRETLARDLDTLAVPLCVCSREGRIHHLSTAARMTLADDPESARVIDRIPDVALQVTATVGRKSGRQAIQARAVHQVVTTSIRRYRLSAALATHAMHFGRTDVLVTINALEQNSPAGDLASRYALSARERQVAGLLARGLSNEQIARTLSISVHTAKRHAEHIFVKLGVRRRSAVAALVTSLGR